MAKRIWIGITIGLLTFVFIYLAVGLSNGERLEYKELVFMDQSTQEQPLASCLEYHEEVVSNMDIYNEFIDDCDFLVDESYTADYFTENIFVIMFLEESSNKLPKAFYDYLFMNDGYEVIQVRYRHPLFGPTKDRTWYVYFIEMRKDQIHSKDIFFD